MSARTFKVFTVKNNLRKAYVVSDLTEEELEEEDAMMRQLSNSEKMKYYDQDMIRPRVATFVVSQLYDEAIQNRRAWMLADYLNKIQEATEKAIRNTTLIDAMSIKNP